jgi:uncharacterized membrane protein
MHPRVGPTQQTLDVTSAPAWKRVTDGETRWAVTAAIGVAIFLQLSLPSQVSLSPHLLVPGLEGVLLVANVVANPVRMGGRTAWIRGLSIALVVVLSAANAWSAIRLVSHLVQGTLHQDAPRLLLTGGAIWVTNVIGFALWYWELDRGGPGSRAKADRAHLDFLFPQMADPELAPADWEPEFVDYLYVSYTNATAFSPTDAMPLTRWLKMTMLLQSSVSLSIVALVVARAVNTLR